MYVKSIIAGLLILTIMYSFLFTSNKRIHPVKHQNLGKPFQETETIDKERQSQLDLLTKELLKDESVLSSPNTQDFSKNTGVMTPAQKFAEYKKIQDNIIEISSTNDSRKGQLYYMSKLDTNVYPQQFLDDQMYSREKDKYINVKMSAGVLLDSDIDKNDKKLYYKEPASYTKFPEDYINLISRK